MNEVKINEKMKLSEHFKLAEFCKTSYHTLDGNIPSHVTIENLKRLCQWLEVMRKRYNEKYGFLSKDKDKEMPVIINSGYRSEEVNRKCGGAKESNHLTGCAVDIGCLGPEQMIRYACILLDTADENGWVFDELIQEKRGTTYWIHFAVRPKDNRRKILFDCR